jgi:cellulose synthase/poly-beta-1,6-N-acetylglucosamine synthase-like glycosyltransferase
MALFWGPAVLLGYLYAGFPLIAVLRGLLLPRPIRRGDALPRISLIITAYNEESLIEAKLNNTLELEYPRERLEVLVASDGSSDRTNAIVASFEHLGVRLVARPRRGKNATMSAAAAAATGEILVFSDADMAIGRDALIHLVAPFEDDNVGGVAGERRRRNAAAGTPGRRLGLVSRWFNGMLSSGGSVTIAGLLYGIRREHFRAVPGNVVDDFFIPAGVLLHRQRLIFEPRAATYPLGSPRHVRAPFRRMLRMNVQYLHSYVRLAGLFNPRRTGFYSIQLLSHKALRRFSLIPAMSMLLTGATLWRHGVIYRAVAIGGIGFHTTAALGWILATAGCRLPPMVRRIVASDRDLAAAVVALPAVWLLNRADRWETQRAQEQLASAG